MTGNERDVFYLLVSAKTRAESACDLAAEALASLKIALGPAHRLVREAVSAYVSTVGLRDALFAGINAHVDAIVARDGDR